MYILLLDDNSLSSYHTYIIRSATVYCTQLC